MVTTFNQKDLVSFGRYLSSPERRALFEATQEGAPTSLEERLADVYHSDIENWKEWLKGKTKVRAKFECVSIMPEEHAEHSVVRLTACVDGSEENKSFSKYTPSGYVEICIDKDAPALDAFESGKEYYLDFTKID